MGREREEKEARGESEEVKPVVGHGRPHRPLPLTLHVAGGGGRVLHGCLEEFEQSSDII